MFGLQLPSYSTKLPIPASSDIASIWFIQRSFKLQLISVFKSTLDSSRSADWCTGHGSLQHILKYIVSKAGTPCWWSRAQLWQQDDGVVYQIAWVLHHSCIHPSMNPSIQTLGKYNRTGESVGICCKGLTCYTWTMQLPCCQALAVSILLASHQMSAI